MAKEITTLDQLRTAGVETILEDRDGRAVWLDRDLGWCAANGTEDIYEPTLIEDGAPFKVLRWERQPMPEPADDPRYYAEDMPLVEHFAAGFDLATGVDEARLAVEMILVEYRRYANEHRGQGKTFAANRIIKTLQEL